MGNGSSNEYAEFDSYIDYMQLGSSDLLDLPKSELTILQETWKAISVDARYDLCKAAVIRTIAHVPEIKEALELHHCPFEQIHEHANLLHHVKLLRDFLNQSVDLCEKPEDLVVVCRTLGWQHAIPAKKHSVLLELKTWKLLRRSIMIELDAVFVTEGIVEKNHKPFWTRLHENLIMIREYLARPRRDSTMPNSKKPWPKGETRRSWNAFTTYLVISITTAIGDHYERQVDTITRLTAVNPDTMSIV